MEDRRGFRALIVEDDDAVRRLVKKVLEKLEFTVESVRDGGEAIELLKTVAYDLLILDLVLPIVNGEEVLAYLEQTRPESLRRVIIASASPRKLSCEFLEKICRILAKPFDIDKLIVFAQECSEKPAA